MNLFADLIVEKKYVDICEDCDWQEVPNVEAELFLIGVHYQDPGLLMYAGSQFRTPWALYRVSHRKTRAAVVAAQ